MPRKLPAPAKIRELRVKSSCKHSCTKSCKYKNLYREIHLAMVARFLSASRSGRCLSVFTWSADLPLLCCCCYDARSGLYKPTFAPTTLTPRFQSARADQYHLMAYGT